MHSHPRAPDRRVVRTREVLLDALAALLMECGYERITIQAIIDRAGVGRATFYAHFEGKDDLLAASIDRLGHLLRTAQHASVPREPLAFTRALFEHLDSHRRIYALSVCNEEEITVERMVRQLLESFVKEAVTVRHIPTPDEALVIQYVVGALWSTIVWWLDHGQGMSPAEVDARFRRLALPALTAARR